MHCEDYPCCGHAPGECEDRPEFHADYWRNRIQQLEDQGYDDHEIDMMLEGV